MTFPWSELSTARGPATNVPYELLRAGSVDEALDCLDIVLAQAAFVCDAGALNRGAPPFVREMFAGARRRHARGLAPWPFLRGIMAVMAARASFGDHFGLAPAEGPFLVNAPASIQDALVWQGTQLRLHGDVDVEVRRETELLAKLVGHGTSEDRAAALVVAILADVDAGVVRAAVEEALGREANLRTRAALQLGWARLRGRTPAVVEAIRGDLEAGGVRGAGAAVACLVHDAMRAPDALVLGRIREALSHVSEPSSQEVYDYGWHRELLSGEAARAVWQSRLAHGLKIELLTAPLGAVVPERGGFALAAPEMSPSTPAAWFLMRVGLARHYHRDSILGPEDVDPHERDVLARLDRERSWLTWGGFFPERFGIASFVRVIKRLLGQDPDALSHVVEGIWARRCVRWSRWKWLRSSIDQTLLGAPSRQAAIDIATEVVGDVELEDLVSIVIAAAGEPDLPFQALLRGLLQRVARSSARSPAAPKDTYAGARSGLVKIADPATRALVELALATAFGSPSDFEGAQHAATSLPLDDATRAALEQVGRARGLR